MKNRILIISILLLALQQGMAQSPASESGENRAFCRDLNRVIKEYPNFKKLRGNKISDSKAFAGENNNRYLSKRQVSGTIESAIQHDKRWYNGWVFGISLLDKGGTQEARETFDLYSGYIQKCNLPVTLKVEEIKERGINKTLLFRPAGNEKAYENLVIKLINVGFVSFDIKMFIYSEE